MSHSYADNSMSMIYPNPIDIYGFCPIEADVKQGDKITDKHTGMKAKARIYGATLYAVYHGNVFPIAETRSNEIQ